MTNETSPSTNAQPALLQQIWMDCLRSVVGQLAGFPVTVEASAGEETTPGDKPPVCMVITAAKALQGEMAILAAEAGALTLSQVLVSEPPDASAAFDKDRRDAFEELIRQVLGQISTSLRKAAGGEVEVKSSGSDVPSWTGASRLGIRITSEKFEPIQLALMVSPELIDALQPRPAVAAPPASAPDLDPATTAARSSNLEMLLDVKLDATIRFGQKRMLLREILELHPGTAVALDRQVQEPVELLVGGRVIAKGDVVIVDGNYGIRISEVMSPQQRIESLGK